ncbi:hypothetical protein BO71DRAFT_189593 [Aspergillus ellipticus CBS 707.79]|uniref:Uncharacterized protein n=1 Tax=Aspergillus ellipticus CBS 707.79 TaxID=1448320 RepID=A0A319DEZ6_9EURO|nr:hypothetical protein BO71DRAFT_189593 [Aspergillus ellipticus CBS 707.79]
MTSSPSQNIPPRIFFFFFLLLHPSSMKFQHYFHLFIHDRARSQRIKKEEKKKKSFFFLLSQFFLSCSYHTLTKRDGFTEKSGDLLYDIQHYG